MMELTTDKSPDNGDHQSGVVRCRAEPATQEIDPMSECEFYNVKRKAESPSKQIRSDRQRKPPRMLELPWCAHAESPVTEKLTTEVLAGGNLLKCGGDLVKCPIADKL